MGRDWIALTEDRQEMISSKSGNANSGLKNGKFLI
jgi:hypothetical protein